MVVVDIVGRDESIVAAYEDDVDDVNEPYEDPVNKDRVELIIREKSVEAMIVDRSEQRDDARVSEGKPVWRSQCIQRVSK